MAETSSPSDLSRTSRAVTRWASAFPAPRAVYACDDSQKNFVNDFVAAWAEVLNLDRFDVV